MSNAIQIELLRREYYQLEKRKEEILYYQEQGENDVRLVWCADLGEIQTGKIVGTREVDREIQGMNIVPAFTDGAAYNAERDGIASFFGTWNVYYQILNFIIAPGFEKWNPMARMGDAFDINYEADTCSVNLRPYTSGMLPKEELNRFENLTNARIEYQDCNADPFEEGDVVLVEFEDQNWNIPVVKGFKSNPKPCEPKELVYVQMGGSPEGIDGFGIVWDIDTNAYPVDFVGIKSAVQCAAYLAGKTETTTVDPYHGLPYTRALWTFFADGTEHDKITTWGLAEVGENPGYLYDKPQVSNIEYDLGDGDFERVIIWEATVTPWGTIEPAYETNYFYHREGDITWFQPGGETLYSFSTWDYFDSFYVCPLDYDPAYGTYNSTNNDVLGLGYPGAAMSENSYVQVIFSSHATGTLRPTFPKTYTSGRETITACTCGTYPWLVGEDEILDPQLQDLNVDFSAAVNTLIEALHAAEGEVLMIDSPDWDDSTCGSTPCANSECLYWRNVNNPYFKVRLYKK